MTNRFDTKQFDADKVILLIILSVSAILRFCSLGSVPFMHDELSALSRTSYDSLHDLLKYGVMLNDSHPAGVQVFLFYWVKLFGWNELWLKLPSALMGVASVYLVYVVGRQWFNKNVGLISAAFLAVSELFVFYSQLIRPYSPGLFFVLLFVYFWNRILFDKRDVGFGVCVGFALSAFCAAEMQMFSMAEAGLIAATGLFFLRNVDKKRRKAYLCSCVAALLLFAPTAPIFYYQIFVYGSIGGWLSQPTPGFIIDFLSFSCNYSKLFIFGSAIVILLPLILGIKNSEKKAVMRVVCLAWFVIPLAVALAYSYVKEPIIQYSTLIFSFPFLVVAAFSFFDEKQTDLKVKSLVVGAILLFGVTSLLFDRQYYKQVTHQGFDQIAESMAADYQRYNDDISFVSYADRSFMNEFYQERAGVSDALCFCQEDAITDFQDAIRNLSTSYLGVGLADHADISWELAALAEYPYLVDEKVWFTTRYLTLSKVDNGKPLLKAMTLKDGRNAENIHVGKSMTWACNCVLPFDSISSDVERIGFVADIQAVDTIKDLSFIATAVDVRNDSTLLFRGYDVKGFVIEPGENRMLPCGFFIPDVDRKYLKIKVFIWNKGNVEFEVNDISYYEIKKNTYFYGLYNPL